MHFQLCETAHCIGRWEIFPPSCSILALKLDCTLAFGITTTPFNVILPLDTLMVIHGSSCVTTKVCLNQQIDRLRETLDSTRDMTGMVMDTIEMARAARKRQEETGITSSFAYLDIK